MTDDNKIYELMSKKVRELNNRIDTNLNTYISEVAHSRAIRSNILDNIQKDAASINDFIEGFQLQNIKRHYIAEALAKDPNQDILDIMSKRCDNILDDDRVITLPNQEPVIIQNGEINEGSSVVDGTADVYTDGEEVSVDIESVDTDSTESTEDDNAEQDNQENVAQDIESDTVNAEDNDEAEDTEQESQEDSDKSSDALINDTPVTSTDADTEATAESATIKPKQPKRTYSLVIDHNVDDNESGRYTIVTTIYVTPRGKVVDENDNNTKESKETEENTETPDIIIHDESSIEGECLEDIIPETIEESSTVSPVSQ